MASRPDPILAQARAAEARGDLRTAANLYQQIIHRRPRAADAHRALGLLLARAGQIPQAIPHLQNAAQIEPANPAHHHALAHHLAAIDRHDEAIDAYNTARRLDPANATAHVDAAILLEMRGKPDEARDAVAHALAADPDHQRARILAIRLDFRAGRPDHDTLTRWRDQLRTIADDAETEVTRALALDILIDVHERLDEFDDAWAAIERCNRADRTATGPRLPPQPRRDRYLATIDALAAFTTPERCRRWRDQCPDDDLPSPTLLVGFPRSGTTMTERALDAHPRLTSVEEQPTFESTRAQIPNVLPKEALARSPVPQILDECTPDHVARFRTLYWQTTCRLLGLSAPPTDRVILDKMPLRITDLPFVNLIFPDAKILVALRDPRDVCLSCVRQRFGYAGNVPMSFFLDPADTAALYARVMSSWLTARQAYTLNTTEIRYEDTVADFEPRIRAMLDALELEWDDAVLSFHQRTDRAHNTPSYHAVSQKISSRAVGRWRRYEPHLAPILPTLRPFIEAFGYA